jgi:predicted RNase H-like HicB family nuclease
MTVTTIIEEEDGSFAVACSALGVYSVGRTLPEAKKNFKQALELHMQVLRQCH